MGFGRGNVGSLGWGVLTKAFDGTGDRVIAFRLIKVFLPVANNATAEKRCGRKGFLIAGLRRMIAISSITSSCRSVLLLAPTHDEEGDESSNESSNDETADCGTDVRTYVAPALRSGFGSGTRSSSSRRASCCC
jgi:hypothetical protein